MAVVRQWFGGKQPQGGIFSTMNLGLPVDNAHLPFVECGAQEAIQIPLLHKRSSADSLRQRNRVGQW